MLKHLNIQNYALIKKLDISFDPGFSVITGETGAGKSIMLGALGLILGNRADTDVLFDENSKCIIEGTFSVAGYGLKSFFKQQELDYEETTFLRREINKSGKSRAFINDTPVTLNVLKELGDRLVNIHSQHKTITLNDSNFQLAVLDDFAGHHELLQEYRENFRNFKNVQTQLKSLIDKEEQSRADQDYFQFQFDELDKANLTEGEQEEIEKELELLENAAEIKSGLFNAANIFRGDESNLLQQLGQARNLIRDLSKYYDQLSEVEKRIQSNLIDLQDISSELESLEENIQHDPERIDYLNDRLGLIFQLQQKHRVKSVKELIEIREELNTKLFSIGNLSEEIAAKEKELQQQEKQLSSLAEEITKNRKAAAPEFEKNIVSILKEVGMPEARFKLEILRSPHFLSDGTDQVRFLFNANKGAALNEISKVASGGELSRLMLAIKSTISGKNLLPTIIFDEIDMGISGEVADKAGRILLKMAQNMQVLAITHLPQIAGKGHNHYLVYKNSDYEKTVSEIRILNSEERAYEIAKMLSGEQVSEVAVKNARELLNKTN